MSALFDFLHLHATAAIILAAFAMLVVTAVWTVKSAQRAKERPASGLYAFREPPSRWS